MACRAPAALVSIVRFNIAQHWRAMTGRQDGRQMQQLPCFSGHVQYHRYEDLAILSPLWQQQ